AALSEALPETAGADTLLAVRSSATAEDKADASFAGQYATVLGVRGEVAISEAIVTCWRSFFSANALVERAGHGLLGEQEAMAVLIQPVVEAECAGVCFSADPVQERRDLIVVNATWGLGLGVVDGAVPADTFWVRRQDFNVEKQHVVEKTAQIALDLADGIRQIDVPAERCRAACLPEAWLERIAQFGLAAELQFGRPQDVEWAIAGEQVWILQSRPLTSLPSELARTPPFPVTWANEDEGRHLWRLTQYSQGKAPPLPLEHDYMAVRESVREETCKFLGADRNEMMKIWNGRAYVRPIPLDLTEADMRIRQTAQEDLKDRLQRQGLTSWDYWGPEVVKSAERLRAFDVETADGPALAEHLEKALAVLRRSASIHPRAWFKPRQPFFDAFAAVSGLSGQAAETAAYQLLDGEENTLTGLIDGLYTLAYAAREEAAVAALVAHPPTDVMDRLAALPEASPFLARLDEFLAVYGERIGEGYGSEMTVLTPTWREEPERLLHVVAAYLDPNREAPAAVRARARQKRDAQVETLCEACGDETAVAEFRRQLAYARKAMAVLEDHNHWIEQVSGGLLRQAIMAAAGWLVDRGELAMTDNVFWLTFDEIGARLRAETPDSLGETIAARQAQHAEWARLEPPPILGVPAADLPPRPPLQDEVCTEAAWKEGTLAGLGASPGQYEGRARVVARGVMLPNLALGDVLVAENAGPLWTPFFPILGALVLENGSLGQHAAATAREYGVPAVIGAKDATRLIADGDMVIVNGTTGMVEVLPATVKGRKRQP
ncbi:MAG TPA: PEP/pyruvate-binding domain-containing protein, partial [Anaerolineae bacterium]